jgi:hypothetical protein
MRNPDLALWKALLCLPQRTTSGGTILKKKILAHTNRPEIAHPIAHPTLDFLGLRLFSHKIPRLGNKKYYFFE